MAMNNLCDFVTPAQEIRRIVLSKENLVWATNMSKLKVIFRIPHLGRTVVKGMLDKLLSEGVECSSRDGEPTQEKDPVFLLLRGCDHSIAFGEADEPPNHNGHVSHLSEPVAG